MDKLEVGTKVRYHGSIDYMHGEYEIIGVVDPDYHRAVKGDAVVDAYYPGDEAYDLWPVGVPRKFGNRDRSLSFVRRASITVLEGAQS